MSDIKFTPPDYANFDPEMSEDKSETLIRTQTCETCGSIRGWMGMVFVRCSCDAARDCMEFNKKHAAPLPSSEGTVKSELESGLVRESADEATGLTQRCEIRPATGPTKNIPSTVTDQTVGQRRGRSIIGCTDPECEKYRQQLSTMLDDAHRAYFEIRDQASVPLKSEQVPCANCREIIYHNGTYWQHRDPGGCNFPVPLKSETVPTQKIKILFRKNLKMSPGKLAAQSVHAALGLSSPHPLMSVVVLGVSDAKFEENKPRAQYLVRDAGYTEVPAGTETCLAFYEDNHDTF